MKTQEEGVQHVIVIANYKEVRKTNIRLVWQEELYGGTAVSP